MIGRIKLFTRGANQRMQFSTFRVARTKNTVVSEQGKEAVIALLGAEDFFGEGCLGGEVLRLATAAVLTKCVIARISKADITRMIHEEPAFAELFISHLLARTVALRRTWSINRSIRARNG